LAPESIAIDDSNAATSWSMEVWRTSKFFVMKSQSQWSCLLIPSKDSMSEFADFRLLPAETRASSVLPDSSVFWEVSFAIAAMEALESLTKVSYAVCASCSPLMAYASKAFESSTTFSIMARTPPAASFFLYGAKEPGFWCCLER